ncbi:MAG: fibronectin type III domain-containing protein [Opitutales bacterium]|jgi:hypothetical protein
MKRTAPIIILAGALMLTTSSLKAFDTPSPISISDSDYTEPYCYTGLTYTSDENYIYVGSGYQINEKAIVTATHVIFDDIHLTWKSGIRFDRAFNDNLAFVSGTQMTGSMHIASYSQALAADNEEDAFNEDIAIVYTTNLINPRHGSYTIKRYGEPSLAAERWNAMLLGYPVAQYSENDSRIGLMHRTGPAHWIITATPYSDTTPTTDHYGVRYAEYLCEDMIVYGGNSGGPLLVYDESDGRYTFVGYVTASYSSNLGQSSLFRIIDQTAQDLIEAALAASSSSNRLSPPTISAVGTSNGITLTWVNQGMGQTGWDIRRNNGLGWIQIASAAANALTYTDSGAEPGITYNYRIRSVKDLGTDFVNRGPWSATAAATVTGVNENLAAGAHARYLSMISGGDAPFVSSRDFDELFSGKILNSGNSWLETRVIGPGTLTFIWSASCEMPESGHRTDAITLKLDGTEQRYIGGTTGENSVTQNIGSGSHTVRWTYTKDAYNKDGLDKATVKDLSFYYSGSAEAFPGGVATSGNWRSSSLLGTYYNFGNRWIFAANGMGYIYVYPQSSQGDWTANHGLWTYMNDPAFGWCWAGMDDWPWMWSASKGWIYFMENGWFWVAGANRYEQINTGAIAYVE